MTILFITFLGLELLTYGHAFYNFGKGFHRHQINAFIFSHKHVCGSRNEDFSKLPIGCVTLR